MLLTVNLLFIVVVVVVVVVENTVVLLGLVYVQYYFPLLFSPLDHTFLESILQEKNITTFYLTRNAFKIPLLLLNSRVLQTCKLYTGKLLSLQ